MDPALIARLLALPALRKQAEEDARALFAAVCALVPSESPVSEEAANLVIEAYTLVFLRSLSDFDHWVGQAWALREIGRLLGWDCGDEVPTMRRTAGIGRQAHEAVVWTVAHGEHAHIFQGRALMDAVDDVTVILGLTIQDRPAAIAAILLHLSGVANG